MQIEYRIKHVNGLMYPQCRIKKWLFWGSWYRIAKHPSGFGLYPNDEDEYPKSKDGCLKIISEFHSWKKDSNTKTIVYSPVILSK